MRSRPGLTFAVTTALSLALAVAPSSSAHAKPLHIRLNELVAKATTIAIATYVGPTSPGPAYESPMHSILVERVLRGSRAIGPRGVRRAPNGAPDIPPGTRCVVFLDRDDQFQWVATLEAGSTLETGALLVRGFYDFNAYLVSPALMTLGQLEGFLRTGELSWTATGKLHFLNEKTGELAPSDLTLTATLPAHGPATLAGLPPLAGFPEHPEVRITSGFGAHVSIIYSYDSGRPLEISGTALGVDAATGTLQTLFWIAEPRLLTRDAFEKYVRSARVGPPYWELELLLEGGDTWRITLDKEVGRIGTLARKGKVVALSSLSMAPERKITAGGGPGRNVSVTLGAPARAPRLVEGWGALGMLIQELYAGPIPCSVVAPGGGRPGTATPCRLKLGVGRLGKR